MTIKTLWKPTALLFILLLPGMLSASLHKVDLSDAIRNKNIRFSAVNVKGSFISKAVRLTITNLKKDSLDITANIGVILKPEDAQYQPMVLAGEENIVLAPGQKGDLDVMVFCGNSYKHGPVQGLIYTFSRVGSDTLIKVIRFINDNSLFNYLGQSAVWTVTNTN